MKRLLVLFLLGAGIALSQAPSAGCFNTSGSTFPCSMIPTVIINPSNPVNTKVSAGSGTTITQAFTVAPGKGDTLLCLGMESAAAIPVFTDADTNTWAVVKSSATAPGYTIAVARELNATPTTDTITLTTTSGAASFACYDLLGAVSVGQAWDTAAFDAQQATATTISFVPTTATIPGEMVFAAAGFTTGQTVNATPALGGNNTALVTVDAANTAVTGGAALAVFYAAHTTLANPSGFTQTMALSGSVVFSGVMVSIRPPSLTQTAYQDACQLNQWQYYPISVSANTQVVAGLAGKNVYACGVFLSPVAAAANFNLVESATSGNACATSPTGMLGGATAALGAQAAINGGYVLESPVGRAVAKTATAGDAMCIFASAQVTGVLYYVQQ
jgi:hypothetical protein